MKEFNIIVWSDDNKQYDHVVKAISTEGLEFLPRLAGYEDADFVVGQYQNKWCVWQGELGILFIKAATRTKVETDLKNLIYDLGRVEYDKAVGKMRLLLSNKNIKLPVNDPAVFSQLNYKFEDESNKQ